MVATSHVTTMIRSNATSQIKVFSKATEFTLDARSILICGPSAELFNRIRLDVGCF